MDKLKKFTSPRVLQEVDLALEKDLLVGPSSVMTILATGHDLEEINLDGYDADDWTID